MDQVSVGATMNVMLGAVFAKGTTIIENAAKEPHIVDLANFINAMGGNIMGAGTDIIKVRGVSSLHGGTYSIIPDQIEAGTYMTAVAAAGGSVEFPEGMDTSAARVVTYPVENTLYISFNGIANRSTEYFVAGGDSMTVTGYATTEASNEKYMYFKIAFWELSDDKTMTSYVPDSTIYYCADGADYQYNVTGLTAGKQYKITISYDNGNKYYVTGGLKVEGLGSTELNTYGDDTTTG